VLAGQVLIYKSTAETPTPLLLGEEEPLLNAHMSRREQVLDMDLKI
jgi:hypothetical protein